MKKLLTKIFAAAVIAAMSFPMSVLTVRAAVNIQLSSVASGIYYYNTDVTLINSSSVAATVDGGALDYPSNRNLSNEGAYGIKIWHRDSRTFTDLLLNIDKTAPIISLSGISNNQVTSQNVTPVFSTNEGNISATLNGGVWFSGRTISNDGTYRLVITARDAAGNVTFRDIMFTIRRGTNPPVTPPTTPTTPATPVPTNGTAQTAKTITRIAKAVTVTAAPVEACAVPCPDPMDAILRDVNVTKIEGADGLGGNLNSCRNVRITGHTQDGLLVILYIKKEGMDVPLIGFVRAGAGNEYQFTTDKPLAEGTYTVFAKLAQEGGKTGPMIEVGHFQVEKCSRWLVWLWLLIILIALIVGSVIGWLVSRRRRRNAEARATDNMEDMNEDALSDEIVEEATDEMDSDRL